MDPAVKDTLRCQRELDEEFFLPSTIRARNAAERAALIDEVIGVVVETAAAQPEETPAEVQMIPATKLRMIVHGVGLLPSDAQFEQIEMMTCVPPAPTAEESSEFAEKLLDRKKLRDLLGTLLETRVLLVDPAVFPLSPTDKGTKLVSVVFTAGEKNVQACFESLWKATGSQVTRARNEASVRCIHVNELKEALAAADKNALSSDIFTEEVLEALFAADMSWEGGYLREDAFLLKFADV